MLFPITSQTVWQIGYDFRGYSPFNSDSESHVDWCAKSNRRHRVKHINIALNRSKKLHFSVNLLIILTQERISETENQWFTVERVAFAWTGTLKTIYLGGKLLIWLNMIDSFFRTICHRLLEQPKVDWMSVFSCLETTMSRWRRCWIWGRTDPGLKIKLPRTKTRIVSMPEMLK